MLAIKVFAFIAVTTACRLEKHLYQNMQEVLRHAACVKMFSKVLLWLRSSLRLPNNWAPFLSKQDQEKILLLWAGVRKHISQQMAIWYKLAYAAQWMIVCDLLPCSRTRSLPRFQAIPETKKDERNKWNYIQLQAYHLPTSWPLPQQDHDCQIGIDCHD